MSEHMDVIDDETRSWARAWADETRRVQGGPDDVLGDPEGAQETLVARDRAGEAGETK